ncbi:discoidin domain-containing protein [Micromonospora rifamycinica]|uniref:discoidin domain-containing protein n=1 Tax=Micromonospora rifamycinica TaxID=291594 RepID=UPI002E289388|nr:discoidin domain-containing protein [Micromonospora rifamycinica]
MHPSPADPQWTSAGVSPPDAPAADGSGPDIRSATAPAVPSAGVPPRRHPLLAGPRQVIQPRFRPGDRARGTTRSVVDPSLPAAAAAFPAPPPEQRAGDRPEARDPAGPGTPAGSGPPGTGATGPGRPVRSRLIAAGIALTVLLAGALFWVGHDRSGRAGSAGDGVTRPARADDPAPPLTLPDPATPVPPRATATSTPRPVATGAPSASRVTPASPTARPSAATPPKARPNTTGANLALRRPVDASSAEADWLAAANAVDGDPQTRWGSAFGDPQWLRIDLGERWQVSRVRLGWEHAYAVAYRVELSIDGTTWTTVHRTTSGRGGVVTIPVRQLPARFVRIYGTGRNSSYGYSLFEVDVR